MFGECLFANESCKYFGRESVPRGNTEDGCRSDEDHIVPRRLARTTLASLYIYSPENIQQLCRDEHDIKTVWGDEPLPHRDDMIDSLLYQIAMGKFMVSKETFLALKDRTIQ